MKLAPKSLAVVAMLAFGFTGRAQTITFTNVSPKGPNAAFPRQNVNGPTDGAAQVAYPYAGQCVTQANTSLFPLLPVCTTSSAPSFACVSTGSSAQSAASTNCGSVTSWKEIAALPPPSVLGTAATVKFQWEVLNPPDYVPDTTTYPNADYYEIGLHEAWGFDGLAAVGAFPNPGKSIGNGAQWTGIRSAAGTPLVTPIWGVGQINMGGGPLTSALTTTGTCSLSMLPCNTAATPNGCNTVTFPGDTCVASGAGIFNPAFQTSEWSPGPQYVTTWPSISIRGTKGRPVVVKWTNEFPNNHLYCPHPEAADWPCAIDRTFMGVRSRIDPALAAGTAIPPDGVNAYGSPQQPDNSWVTHLHGADTPPGTDGFAEKWFGNRITAAKYLNVSQNFVNPPFENPASPPIALKRPGTYFEYYTYPMMQNEATIWFHDHTLGKTHHNVIAGPAGFFPIVDPAQHSDPNTWKTLGTGALSNLANNYTCVQNGVAGKTCAYGWLDILTQPRDSLNRPLYDLFLAIQDRSFNADGTISFPNNVPGGIGQTPPAGVILPAGYTSVTPGPNPQVHPTWVPEYFADHAVVNGVVWPKKTAVAGWYRMRIVNGSDSRCWTLGLQSGPVPAPGAAVMPNVPFYVLANDQGYLRSPVLAPMSQFTMCPGERYELLVDFTAFAGQSVSLTNSAPAPFPVGVTPQAKGSPFADMNVVMVFNVGTTAGVRTCTKPNATNCLMPPGQFIDPAWVDLRTQPAGTTVRQVYLNEKIDGTTLTSLGLQLNGVPFEYKVTETPKKDTTEFWWFVNTTGDAHPMHPHLVKHQIVSRTNFNQGAFLTALCGSTTCQLGPVPGGEMQVVPDVTPMLANQTTLVTAASVEGGYKDVTQALPGMVTAIVAKWSAGWQARVSGPGTAPGASAGCTAGAAGCDGNTWTYDDVTTGPYVWHCHINSHEDSEMMHSSLVVP